MLSHAYKHPSILQSHPNPSCDTLSPTPMSKASKTITLLLVPLSIIFLGFHDCESDDGSYASTRPSSSSSGGSHWFYSGRSYSSGSRSSSYSSGSHSSFSSGTRRGGFGSHAGSFGS